MTPLHPVPYSIKRHGTTLEKCDYEPVQTPGCIQSWGVLLALRPDDLTILQVSENTAEWLGVDPGQLLGTPVQSWLGMDLAGTIQAALKEESPKIFPTFLFTLEPDRCGNSRRLHAFLHLSGGIAILELEDADEPNDAGLKPNYYALVQKSLHRFQSSVTLDQLAQVVTEEVQRESGLDRVMVYYFHADASGEVMAETKRNDLGSWLGFRYPADDIPRPAREIFKKIWSRPLPDAKGALIEIVPLLNPDTQAPLEMTYCSLRGASVMYTEYLQNMGVAATLTMPIVSNGELWGLIACHHYTPRRLPYRVRAACEFLAQAASQQLRVVEEREESAYRNKLEEANYGLISTMTFEPTASTFSQSTLDFLNALDVGGVAIFTRDRWQTIGTCPNESQLIPLGRWLTDQPGLNAERKPAYATDALSSVFPPATDYASIGSGILAIRFSTSPTDLIIWFKPETLQTFIWAGNPNELPVVSGPLGPRLTPRKSFELWRDTVSSRSLPWKRAEIESVVNLRHSIMLLALAQELKQKNNDLTASNERIREQAALLDKAQDAIIVRDLQGSIKFWNKGAARIYGWTRQEAMGRNSADFLYVDPEKFMEVNRLTLSTGEWAGEFQHHTKDGGQLTIEARWTLIRDPEGQPKSVLAIHTDITERKKLEAQFLRAQRMESIGTLAGGIAHDLNNILAPILMSIDLLKTPSDREETDKILATIETSAKRGADIVRQVLSFARGVEGERLEIQPKHLLNDLERIIKNTFPKDIRLYFEVPGDIWTLLGDPTQIHQVLLNLCVNARDAMPNGGSLTVGVENCVLNEAYETLNIQVKPGRYVKIRVTDSGMGIPPGLIGKIFEPFFTTKDLSKGTGLGLSTVMAIVKSHGGTISVYSEQGKGTSFTIYLPVMEVSSEAMREQVELANLPRGNGETVLVVDDEPSILAITSQTLLGFGYQVLTANDGADAVGIYVQHRGEIAVVLTDMMMPVMDGPAMIHALRRINPAIKTIAASGLNVDGSAAKATGEGVKHFLTKPYTTRTLLNTIRLVLDEA
jgi:PAS domain S-box-containing protein